MFGSEASDFQFWLTVITEPVSLEALLHPRDSGRDSRHLLITQCFAKIPCKYQEAALRFGPTDSIHVVARFRKGKMANHRVARGEMDNLCVTHVGDHIRKSTTSL